VVFAIATLFMGWQASQLRVDAGFQKLLPMGHPFIKTFVHYSDEFGGANRLLIALRAREGDIFTPAVREAFRHASQAALGGPRSASSRAYMQPGAPNPRMRLEVNSLYPDTEPVTAIPPELLAAYPPLPAEVAYRVVGRTLILLDVKSRLLVDVARLILPLPS